MDQKLLNDGRARMAKVVESLKGDFAKIRTGRASPALLEDVQVEYYGSRMKLNQLATISIPESRTLVISPWDKGAIAEIEKGVLKADLGLTPTNDGKLVLISIPQPTEERRKDLVRQAKKMAEEGRVTIRNIRRETNEAAKGLQKKGECSEDDLRRGGQEIQKMTDQFIAQIDQALSGKEKEIMEV